MSKRHTTSRRRSYGRRQHELHERIDRITERRRGERAWRASHTAGLDAIGYFDVSGSDQSFGFPD
jgi:hypothetical protein